tara:strand:- start:8 stop:199 length:192 start_codon:yes stop_codon:yes gene_type:complete
MELEKEIQILGFFVTTVLSQVTQKEFEDKDWDFIYGADEYNGKDLTKNLKQLKRLWRTTRYSK